MLWYHYCQRIFFLRLEVAAVSHAPEHLPLAVHKQSEQAYNRTAASPFRSRDQTYVFFRLQWCQFLLTATPQQLSDWDRTYKPQLPVTERGAKHLHPIPQIVCRNVTLSAPIGKSADFRDVTSALHTPLSRPRSALAVSNQVHFVESCYRDLKCHCDTPKQRAQKFDSLLPTFPTVSLDKATAI